VSLSPRSGRNERSEWRTAAGQLIGDGAQPPRSLISSAVSASPDTGAGPSFQVYLARLCPRASVLGRCNAYVSMVSLSPLAAAYSVNTSFDVRSIISFLTTGSFSSLRAKI
jgi:hypothetical protein